MKKVCVIGHFAFGKEYLDGQTVKTKIMTTELQRRFGEAAVGTIDTHGGKKLLLKLPFCLFGVLGKHENAVMLPARNGVRVIAPLLVYINKLFRRKLHYVVIGGWLPNLLSERPRLARVLRAFDGIYVETTTMKTAMEKMGFDNIFVMPNCKDLHILTEDELVYATEEPYKLCTFSRVMKEKGIEDAVEAVKRVNEQHGKTVFSLDIYGQVDPEQTAWFDELKASFPSYIRYGGMVPFNQSVEVIKEYFALLFPTQFFTEGIPGTIIDAYAAGVPVISAKWESYDDILDEETAIGYSFGDKEALIQALHTVAVAPKKMIDKKTACVERAQKFLPGVALNVLAKGL